MTFPNQQLSEEELQRLRATGASLLVQAALVRHIVERRPTGHFVTALLSNNLLETVNRADDENILAVRALVTWLYNDAPGPCWGSPEKVKAWLAEGLERDIVEEARVERYVQWTKGR